MKLLLNINQAAENFALDKKTLGTLIHKQNILPDGKCTRGHNAYHISTLSAVINNRLIEDMEKRISEKRTCQEELDDWLTEIERENKTGT